MRYFPCTANRHRPDEGRDMMTNRFPGRCSKAGCQFARFNGVPEGKGFVTKNNGTWLTWCQEHAPERITEQAAPEKDRLNANGSLTWQYNAANLPLVRAFPGYRNTKDASGKWNASV